LSRSHATEIGNVTRIGAIKIFRAFPFAVAMTIPSSARNRSNCCREKYSMNSAEGWAGVSRERRKLWTGKEKAERRARSAVCLLLGGR